MDDMIQYLKEFAEPTIKDFEENPTSVRHAFLACVVTFHAIDYLAHPRRSRTKSQNAKSQSPDFVVVDKVAHAFKHVISGNRASDLRANEVIPRPPAFYGTAVYDLSRWGDAVGGVTLDRERGVDLLETVKRAVEFLRTQGQSI